MKVLALMLRAGPFRIDLAAERLWHGADAIPLKTWAVLRHLVDAAGRVVTKQALLDRVWVRAIRSLRLL